MIRPAALALALTATAFCTARAQGGQPIAWTQYVGGTRAEVRALAALGGGCPEARADGARLPLQVRAAPDAAFPQAVCAAALPAAARRLEVAGVRLAVPRPDVRRIVVLGDSGCRLKGAKTQACNDPAAWPFPTVARLAAARRPDLVIHVGDYLYRESPCPRPAAGPAKPGCAGSPFGDDQPAWDADLFEPARPLLEAAPWVFVRGNHESCSRAGAGWFRLLDAAPRPPACPAVSPPVKVALGGLNLYLLDGADADDRFPSPAAVAAYAAQLDALRPDLARPGQGWIITHRPVWGLVPALKLGPLGTVEAAINATEQAALHGREMPGVQMVVSGHIHHFAAFDFGPARPAQLIVGTGGDVGEAADSPTIRTTPAEIDGLTAQRFTFYRFGYLVLDRVGTAGSGEWTGGFYDIADRLVAACRLHARALTCRGV